MSDMIEKSKNALPDEVLCELNEDTEILSEQANRLLDSIAPYSSVSKVDEFLSDDSNGILESFNFYKLCSCTTEELDELMDYLTDKMCKFFNALYRLDTPIIYGVISQEGQTNIVLGINSALDKAVFESVAKGSLTGIEMTEYKPNLKNAIDRKGGIISAVPVFKIDDEKQNFNISTAIRCLNNKEYAILFMARPYCPTSVHETRTELIDIKDKCFSVSKRNIARAKNYSKTDGSSTSTTTSHTGSLILYSYNKSTADSTNFSETIGDSDTTSFDMQNGIALEIMEYCDRAIERIKIGESEGVWETSIAFAAQDDNTAKILKSCVCGELAKPAPDMLPLRSFDVNIDNDDLLRLPKVMPDGSFNSLNTLVTSSELGMVCTPPYEAVPNFELKQGKVFPMISSSKDGIVIGTVSDGNSKLDNIPFSLSEKDLNKHTFICGITGSGKTTTVKRILTNCNKPFMVIESAKKEYRNIKDKEPTVYTLGKPELNCLRINPFYIQQGINLQTHIDFLKDLFNASFSFYGPMPYILERCLHNVYSHKGWNMTLGYHPHFVNNTDSVNFFDDDYMKSRYDHKASKHLFPTMQELKDEVKRYVEEEMQYDGEISGNVKTAMLARLDSLCVGSKGFMFNTNETIDMESLMQKNVVFELEGLADDSDKAFGVGLLVVFINEYRQVFKENHITEDDIGLQHLLVIEEAHRLLKNVDTERSTEDTGNPKGKAVEHFTNMIAEMRSYGQGVIIAEQIPSKLAPDVIKNSSNKIIQRVVSADDQQLVANTIGMNEEDAVLLGSLKTGIGLCHKEGMSLPVYVEIEKVSDNKVADGDLYTKQEGAQFVEINKSIVIENTVDIIENLSLQVLCGILAESPDKTAANIKEAKEIINTSLVRKDVKLLLNANKDELYGGIIADNIISYLINGVFSFKELPSNTLCDLIHNVCSKGLKENVKELNEMFTKAYSENCKSRCIRIISELVKNRLNKSVNIPASIERYFIDADKQLISEIEEQIKGVG